MAAAFAGGVAISRHRERVSRRFGARAAASGSAARGRFLRGAGDAPAGAAAGSVSELELSRTVVAGEDDEPEVLPGLLLVVSVPARPVSGIHQRLQSRSRIRAEEEAKSSRRTWWRHR